MKERPIIFTGDSPKKILAGTKTMTRRVFKKWQVPKLLDGISHIDYYGKAAYMSIVKKGIYRFAAFGDTEEKCLEQLIEYGGCPYGKIGSKLWVREAWNAGECADKLKPSELWPSFWLEDNGGLWYKSDDTIPKSPISKKGKNRSPLFLPKWASRIKIEITNIKAEKIQEISEEDSIKEGCVSTAVLTEDRSDYTGLFAVEKFNDLWNTIHGKKGCSWRINPLVWAIEFKLI